MFRTLVLVGSLVALSITASADCPGDCAIAYGICYGSWNVWDAVCQTTAWNRYQVDTDNCTYFCSSPCDPGACQSVADGEYDAESGFCDNTVWDGIDGCNQDLAECLAQCVT
jgi:hypothetical protein